MTLRKLINDEKTVERMLHSEFVIGYPAHHYFGAEEMTAELKLREEQHKKSLGKKKTPVRYRTRAQMEEEKEEIAIADELTNIKTQ